MRVLKAKKKKRNGGGLTVPSGDNARKTSSRKAAKSKKGGAAKTGFPAQCLADHHAVCRTQGQRQGLAAAAEVLLEPAQFRQGYGSSVGHGSRR